MSNIGAINQAAGDINGTPTATTLIGQKPNPWFNVLAAVVIVAGIIYSGIHLADDLSVVRDTRAYPLTLPVSIMLAGGLYWLLRHFL
jgi:ABC-type transport system involved in cytochrome c biogenesis permease subunit